VKNNSPLLLSPQSLKLLIDEAQKKKASIRFKATGVSMMPFIASGDIVTIVPYQKRLPEIGDIAIFIQEKKLFIHRVIKKQSDKFLFKGDNRFSSDGFVDYSNILGKVGNVKRENKNLTIGIGYGKYIVSLFSRLNLTKIIFYLIK